MAPIKRSDMLRVRFAPEETEMATELADADGVTVSDVIRRLVREEHELRGVAAAKLVAKANEYDPAARHLVTKEHTLGNPFIRRAMKLARRS